MKNKVSIFWFRRDLRLTDNTGLHHALGSEFPVLPIFIFDTDILDQLEDKKDRRVDYIHQALTAINSSLKKYGSKLRIYYGKPMEIFSALSEEYDIEAVFCNRDYEPKAIERDKEIYYFFREKNIPFKAYKDQVIFDKDDILKKDGSPYTIYTPFAKKWRETLTPDHYKAKTLNLQNVFRQEYSDIVQLNTIGFEKTGIEFKDPVLDAKIIDEYHKYRDYPALQRTTQLGTALRFGTISIRKCVAFALVHNQTWLSELIWREFFMQILYHFPQVVHHAFKKQYDNIQWRNDEKEFKCWCEGKTGYPIVDAGMRQLNETGYMHNRVRMIVASFLCKHLLIDWRWGEAYFALKLDDYDLSANNGNWQWAAGCGCDAAPYFRVFNPITQLEKFDKDLSYVKKWLPEYNTPAYPDPIVEHKYARDRILTEYARALR
ncbi:TPA: deoxyribodipyrimidine photo-lyase [Elizabethkingia meningoseptica]|uniref:cryptochrome/photolyase family protein n=1 Tax=Elizabethkingia meningoseptica TaxID=238 RepID=UPI0022F18C93|nr:deoxyribodipyrimidine photo-lyase [Elizabethkingia meningoseptica]EJK5329655.1 deoxyribodipyrimidine photo-lyase [Elizabethkingia meningoseptica]WBS75501.1 deoxyribodipyrimidine photo-lyase [Elizabethkingia meningoseptica]HAY3563238.1 deoxyribodipyrimidine photo-lyase [Elizabethkingia meningoseptica]HAY3564583.1 deoxyribodipyrimidine photo-lyase [Elizabethkingia meningoseptica]